MSAYGVSTCDDHDDCIVVYIGRKCPICTMKDEHEQENDNSESKIGELEDKIAELEQQGEA